MKFYVLILERSKIALSDKKYENLDYARKIISTTTIPSKIAYSVP